MASDVLIVEGHKPTARHLATVDKTTIENPKGRFLVIVVASRKTDQEIINKCRQQDATAFDAKPDHLTEDRTGVEKNRRIWLATGESCSITVAGEKFHNDQGFTIGS